MDTTTAYQNAIAFAKRGHPFVPLNWPLEDGRCSCGSASCTGNSRGKHPFAPLAPHGKDSGTTDIAAIKQMFKQYPLLNAGVRTDNLAVVDLDPRNGSKETWPKLVGTRHGELHSWRCFTGGGGDHMFFSVGGRPLASSKLARGVDLQAQGRYVVTAGSRHFSGNRYFWYADCHPVDTPLGEIPQWIRNHSERNTGEVSSLEYYHGLLEPAAPGERHDRVTRLLGHLYGSAFPSRTVLLGLVLSHIRHTYPNLDDFTDEEVFDIAKCLYKKEQKKLKKLGGLTEFDVEACDVE